MQIVWSILIMLFLVLDYCRAEVRFLAWQGLMATNTVIRTVNMRLPNLKK